MIVNCQHICWREKQLFQSLSIQQVSFTFQFMPVFYFLCGKYLTPTAGTNPNLVNPQRRLSTNRDILRARHGSSRRAKKRQEKRLVDRLCYIYLRDDSRPYGDFTIRDKSLTNPPFIELKYSITINHEEISKPRLDS